MATNVNRPNGFRPIGTLGGGDWTASIREYTLDTTHSAMYIGDLVKMTSDGYLDVFAAGDTQVLGVVVGVGVAKDLSASTEYPGYMPANIAGTVRIAMDPKLLMEVQEDGDTTPLTLADVGQNVEIINSVGSTTTGISGMQLDSSTKNTTNTLPIRLLALVNRADNAVATTALPNARWVVTFANHSLASVSVGI